VPSSSRSQPQPQSVEANSLIAPLDASSFAPFKAPSIPVCLISTGTKVAWHPNVGPTGDIDLLRRDDFRLAVPAIGFRVLVAVDLDDLGVIHTPEVKGDSTDSRIPQFRNRNSNPDIHRDEGRDVQENCARRQRRWLHPEDDTAFRTHFASSCPRLAKSTWD
jgi:hypothetical protein